VRTVEVQDMYGGLHYVLTPHTTSDRAVVDALRAVEGARNDLSIAFDRLERSGVLVGNAQSDDAIAVRVTAFQLALLLDMAQRP